MSVLYRKYRPEKFDDVVGQANVTEALKNQIIKGRVGHAYLFTGSRGTGKTTCAKIFARAINCLSPINGSPCGKCEACLSLKSADCVDIIEMDAASNNGVDDIREIREKVKYAPAVVKKKVYIIDEVHMLTQGAFNALLKTLEEPPEHVVFILATTEANKLPQTILSRCMRFDFRLIPTDKIYELVKKVYDEEGAEYEDAAVRLIAKAGEGSARDALSVADRCLTAGEKVTYEEVADVLGVSGWETMSELLCEINEGAVGKALVTLDKLIATGKSVALIAKELTSYARDALAVRSGGAASVVAGEDKLAALKSDAEKYSADMLVTVMNAFSALDAALRYSVSPRIVLECALVKACRLLGDDYSAFAERLARAEKKIAELEKGGAAIVERGGSAPVGATVAAACERQQPAAFPRDAFSCWGKAVTFLRRNESMIVFSTAGEQGDVELKNNVLTVYASDDDSFMTLSTPEAGEALMRAAASVHPDLKIVVDKRAKSVDMDGEIARIKAIAGNAKINVNKR